MPHYHQLNFASPRTDHVSRPADVAESSPHPKRQKLQSTDDVTALISKVSGDSTIDVGNFEPNAIWNEMYNGFVMPLLLQMGRPRDETKTCAGDQLPSVTGITPISRLPDDMMYHTLLAIDGSVLKNLAAQAKIYHMFNVGNKPLHDSHQGFSSEKPDIRPGDVHAAQLTAVVGPVFLLYNLPHDMRLQQPKYTITTVSIVPINLRSCAEDIFRYVKPKATGKDWTFEKARNLSKSGVWTKGCDDLCTLRLEQCEKNLGNENPLLDQWPHQPTEVTGYELDEKNLLDQMKRIWYVILYAMKKEGVECAVLPTLGCGTYCGPFSQIPFLWALALKDTYKKHFSDAFTAVIIAFQCAWHDSLNGPAFHQHLAELNEKVYLQHSVSMMHLADKLASHGKRVGMVNASEVFGVRYGHMYRTQPAV